MPDYKPTKPLTARQALILSLHLEVKTHKEIGAAVGLDNVQVSWALKNIRKGRKDKGPDNPFTRIRAVEQRLEELEKAVYGFFEERRNRLERRKQPPQVK